MTHRLTGTAYGLTPQSAAAQDWRRDAVCRDEDPELFFPIGTAGPSAQQAEAAKAVCRRCGVKDECGSWALGAGQDHGVWGGLTAQGRRLVRQELADRHNNGDRS